MTLLSTTSGGILILPRRNVHFTAGVPVEFTDDEAALLSDEWKPVKAPVKKAPAAKKVAAKTSEAPAADDTPDQGTNEAASAAEEG